jgi:acyl-CoA thioesterase I
MARMLGLILPLALAGPLFGGESSVRFLDALAGGKKQKIVLYGTSLTANAAWPAAFQKRLSAEFGRKAEVVNAARGGKDSRWGLAQIERRVVAEKPDAVFLEFAINDALKTSQLSLAESSWNLGRMIGAIRAGRPDCEIFLMVMNPPTGEQLARRSGIAGYEDACRQAARSHGTGLIDFGPTWSLMIRRQPSVWRKFAPDGIHPSAAASHEVILPHLLAHLGLPPSPSRRERPSRFRFRFR